MAGARVSLHYVSQMVAGPPIGDPVAETATDAEGRYVLGVPTFPGDGEVARVVAETPGYPALARRFFAPQAGSKAEVALDIEFLKGEDLSGVVLLSDGKPAAGAKISVEGPYYRIATPLPAFGEATQMSDSATADELGRFRFANVLLAEATWIRASAPGGAPRMLKLSDVISQPSPTIVLGPPDGSISGRVLDADGEGVAGVHVLVRDIDDFPAPGTRGSRSCSTFTDGGGSFSFPSITAGSYRLDAYPKAGAIAYRYTDTEVSAGEARFVEIAPQSRVGKVRVRGSITETASGAPIADAVVSDRPAWSRDAAGLPRSNTATTGPDGAYEIELEARLNESMEPQFVIVHVSPPPGSAQVGAGPRPEFAVPDPSEPGHMRRDFALTKVPTVQGRVVHGGIAVEGASLSLATNERMIDSGPSDVLSGKDGAFEASLPQAGEWQLRASTANAIGYATVTAAEGESLADVTIELEAFASISGQAVDGAGRPLAHAKVFAQRQRERDRFMYNGMAPWMPPAYTDREGRFAFAGLEPGQYDLSIVPARSAEPHPVAAWGPAASIGLSAGANTTGVDVRPARARCIDGYLQNEEGEPLANIEIRVSVGPGAGRGSPLGASFSDPSRGAITNVEGRFHICGVPRDQPVRLDADPRSGRTRAEYMADPNGSGPLTNAIREIVPPGVTEVHMQAQERRHPGARR